PSPDELAFRSWHRPPCSSGSPADHALPASRGNSRPAAPVRQSAICAPCAGNVSCVSAAGSTAVPPTSIAATSRDRSPCHLLRPSARPQRRPESLLLRTRIFFLD